MVNEGCLIRVCLTVSFLWKTGFSNCMKDLKRQRISDIYKRQVAYIIVIFGFI